LHFLPNDRKILKVLNILRLIPKIVKYCHDCFTPIKSDSKEDIVVFVKEIESLKKDPYLRTLFFYCKVI